MMKLYYSDVLSPRKACAVAKHLKLPIELIYLELGKGEHLRADYLALNPNGKVPTLVDGDRVLWEADAIMCELARRAESDLWPRDARQVEIIRWFSWALQYITKDAGALYFEHIIKKRFGIGPPDPQALEQATANFRRCGKVLNDHLDGRHYVVGDTLTVADFAVAVTLPYAQQAQIPLDELPAVRRWHDRLSELEAWRDPFPPRPSVKP